MICPKCHTDKDLSEYYASKSSKGNWCKRCNRDAIRKWESNNPEKVRASKQKYSAKNKAQVRETHGLARVVESFICSTCKVAKHPSEYHVNTGNRFGLTTRCKVCTAAYGKKWREQNSEILSKKAGEWNKNNLERRREIARESARRRPLEKMREYLKTRRDSLTDSYVRRLLTTQTGVAPEAVPAELVETHRLVIRIKRLIKEMK